MESLLAEENLQLTDYSNLSLSGERENVSCLLEDNLTESCQDFLAEEEKDYLYKTEQLVFLCLLLTVIVSGNSLVLITQLSPRTRRSRMNFFIMHLALADLSVGLLSVSTDIVWKVTMTWEAGLLACKLIRFLQVVVTYASTYVLVALSIDRYDAITHPMAFTGSWRRAKWLVASAWVLSIAFSVPIIFMYHLAVPENAPEFGLQCWIDFGAAWQWKLYMSLVATSLFFIPAVIIASCYAVIVITIWRKGKTMAAPRVTQSLLPRVPLTEARRRKIALESDDCRRASSRGLIPKAKVKTIKMTFVIVFVFILCWSPYIIFDMLQVYELIPSNETVRAIATFIQSLAPLNSAANPVIYFMFSANFSKYFRTSWCRRWCWCCSSPDDPLYASTANTSTSNLRTTSSTLVSSSSSSTTAGYSKQHRDSLLPEKVSTVRFSAATIAAQRF